MRGRDAFATAGGTPALRDSLMTTTPAFKRVLLKLSGEALAANQGFGVETARIHEVAAELADVHKLGVQLAIVVGGGGAGRLHPWAVRDLYEPGPPTFHPPPGDSSSGERSRRDLCRRHRQSL